MHALLRHCGSHGLYLLLHYRAQLDGVGTEHAMQPHHHHHASGSAANPSHLTARSPARRGGAVASASASSSHLSPQRVSKPSTALTPQRARRLQLSSAGAHSAAADMDVDTHGPSLNQATSASSSTRFATAVFTFVPLIRATAFISHQLESRSVRTEALPVPQAASSSARSVFPRLALMLQAEVEALTTRVPGTHQRGSSDVSLDEDGVFNGSDHAAFLHEALQRVRLAERSDGVLDPSERKASKVVPPAAVISGASTEAQPVTAAGIYTSHIAQRAAQAADCRSVS